MVMDFLPVTALCNDGPTAAMRLDIALAGLPHTTGELVGVLNNMRVRGNPQQSGEGPLEVYLSARCGAYVTITADNITVASDDWSYTMRAPVWARHFQFDCEDGYHPLLDGRTSVGDVQPVDIFAGAHS